MDKRILIIGNHFPEPQSSAAGTKMLQWLQLFKENNDSVVYAAVSKSEFSEDISELVTKCVDIQVNDSSFNEFVSDYQPEIIVYDRFSTEEQFGWRVREAVPNAIHILETQDLHFVRESRQHKTTLYNETAKRELASILRCDLSSIISEYEIHLLNDLFPFVKNKIFYFPLCYPIDIDEINPLEDRKDFCFIGNFRHAPNKDAVLFLKKRWSEIHSQIPDASIYVYGAYPTRQILELNDEKNGFFVKGRVESVSEVFSKHKVLLAPIEYGAGLKGKLLEAMKFGIISVTTPIGAEGIGDDRNWNGRVCDLNDFVATTVECYRNEIKYENYQGIGVDILNQMFNQNSFNKTIYELISSVCERPQQWRNTHFLSEIMNHHRQQSVRYLSKWIEAKNITKK